MVASLIRTTHGFEVCLTYFCLNVCQPHVHLVMVLTRLHLMKVFAAKIEIGQLFKVLYHKSHNAPLVLSMYALNKKIKINKR